MEDKDKSWIAKNIMPILALETVTASLLFFFLLVFVDIPKEKENITYSIIGYLAGVISTVTGYYFVNSFNTKKEESIVKGDLVGKIEQNINEGEKQNV